MPEDPKTALPPKEDGSAATASATPPVNGTSDSETTEQTIARLKSERDEALKKAENEAALRKSQQGALEGARREAEAARAATPPTTDPLLQDIAELRQAKSEFDSKGLSDPATNRALREAEAELDERRREGAWREQQRVAAQQIRDAAVSDAMKGRAWQLFMSGKYADGESALMAAKGENFDTSETERKKLEALAEERKAELERRAALAPGSPPSGGGPQEKRDRMKFSEYDRITKADPNGEGKKLRQQRDGGKLVLDMSG